MNNKLIVAVAVLAGLAGGMLTRFIAPAPVFAQAPVQILPAPAPAPITPRPFTKEIRAESFALVDQYDNVVGAFATEPKGVHFPARIVLRDANGREIWSAGGTTIRPLMSTTR
jgi:hypothetical protein